MSDLRDEGPFFHDMKADLRVGEFLTAGFRSNYRPEVVMNHIYFTALPDGAGLAAELAVGEGAPRVYAVEPTGAFEDDPNVTDKKFPGNPTRSYRSRAPLRVVGEVADWIRLTPRRYKSGATAWPRSAQTNTRRNHQLIGERSRRLNTSSAPRSRRCDATGQSARERVRAALGCQ